MGDRKLEDGIREVIQQDPRFDPQAYYFIFEALEYTLSRLNARRHVSGKELLAGIREYALDTFGFLAKTVFYEWGITSTEAIGEIVFNLVRANLLMKQDTDSMADFRDGYDFEDAFDKGFRPHFAELSESEEQGS
jgi:uncharacterized repeat protein (TIGR04138 family)